jgi:hypothetical protein
MATREKAKTGISEIISFLESEELVTIKSKNAFGHDWDPKAESKILAEHYGLRSGFKMPNIKNQECKML